MLTRQGKFHPGDKIRLTAVPDDPGYEPYGLEAGMLGTVEMVDSQETVHVRWDNGERVGITAAHRHLIG